MARTRDGLVGCWVLFFALPACVSPLELGLTTGEVETGARGFDAIVVLGNRPPLDDEGHIAPELARRVEHGVELLHRGVAPLLVFSGGASPGQPPEARVMAEHASSLGVDRGVMLLELTSQSTIQNARFSYQSLCPEGGCHLKVVAVTNRYHAARALPLLRCAGFDARVSPSPLPDEAVARARTWEFWASFAELFIDECARSQAP